MNCVRFLATFLVLATVIATIDFVRAAEPEAEISPFRLLEHKSVFGGSLTNTKIFFDKIPDPRAALCEGRAMEKPESLDSAMKLTEIIESEAVVERIAEQVDFTKEQLILIAWNGHAAQGMHARVDGKGDAQQIVFSDTNSHTDAAKLAKDHVYLYVVAKDAKWKFQRGPQLQVCPKAPHPELPRPHPAPGPNRPQLNDA